MEKYITIKVTRNIKKHIENHRRYRREPVSDILERLLGIGRFEDKSDIFR